MLRRMTRFLIFLIALALPTLAAARPVSYAGGWMVHTENDRAINSASVIYSPTARYSIGAKTEYFNDTNNTLHTLTYNRLLARWNERHSQANIFLLTGVGAGEFADETAFAGSIGLAADWETRRYYTSYKVRGMAADNGEGMFQQKARVGVAPYVANYGSLHTWLMLELDHQPAQEHNVTITPLVRLFRDDWLVEAGYSNQKDVLFNFTYQF